MGLFDVVTNRIFIGEIVETSDPDFNGRVKVYIAELHKSKEDGDRKSATFNCIMSSPFAGGTNYADESVNQKKDYRGSLKSYGLWMTPPDKGTQVLVAFGQANLKYGIIMGCLFPEDRAHMVPGVAGHVGNYNKFGFKLPVGEKNKFDNENPDNGLDAQRPAHLDHAKAIYNQGLIGDGIRGASSSTSRRESPSSVFGVLTPGNYRADTVFAGDRGAGHQFVMDDGDIDGNSKNIRIRTGGGNQILLDDNEGIIYFINKDGKAWMELNKAGGITLFAEGSVDIRAKGDFNLRADRNVNIEAGGDLSLKAAGDTATGGGDQHVGPPPQPGIVPLGYGGNLRMESVAQTSIFSAQSAQLTSSAGDIDISSAGRTAITGGTTGLDLFAGAGGIRALSALGGIHLDSTIGINLTSPAPISLAGLPVLLNSPGGIPSLPATPALTANQITTRKHDDWSSDMPDFGFDMSSKSTSDFTATMSNGPEEIMPNTTLENASGRKKAPAIKSIVSTMPTAEPYRNHAVSDALTHNANSMSEGEYDDDLGPTDSDTPDGYNGG